MNEKTCRRVIIILSVALVGTLIWLGSVYKNGGDTRDSLVSATDELANALVGNANLAKELLGANEINNRLIKEQRESDTYQQQIEDELGRANDIIGQLEIATGELAEGIERVEDIAWKYEELIRQGNKFIEDREE